ncbi:hypothetical protein Cob_v006777 [Colletotrichum orbiculare MAFF 240422]|uniref:Uncharacterized protein n=1 Tax=Colletotrichum orbiculare (strain 104-T / ATCC 96160 / CBS 514.97 / LARS 414 / MAFF 240422) TaxID=1213857 RepID=A0A484FUB0_COLOR|nr:hypothetical protein Cob_v006777 [Colletotrichum orbiculare MAFF 240422]
MKGRGGGKEKRQPIADNPPAPLISLPPPGWGQSSPHVKSLAPTHCCRPSLPQPLLSSLFSFASHACRLMRRIRDRVSQ